ncbi:nitrate reductase [Dinghuibacter silviterrae]|uniref:nitrate reductase (cytochrome) n=1 Tax=Dinghuibacter silviterrae TaxID=1539049 RepID=A0A4R8DSI1_9BACT|nr:nitrate reductase [Dinghuibacter silviterrae]TDX01009.1 ferredoxin-nitrate reductase [Dinghuibacter silviterrae]
MTTDVYKTTCCYCGVGCGVIVRKDKQGALTAEGDPDHPVNRGQLCSKGMNLHHTVNDRSDRLLYPQMRYNKQSPMQRVSWDAALERTAAVFRTFIDKYGPDSVAIYASGQCLTEEYYTLNKLMKGFIGSNNIDTNSRLCMSSAVVAYKMALGEDSVPGCYEDVDTADCIYVDGANPAWCHPILWRRVEAAKAANPDLVLIVADPRRTDTATTADIHLQLRPGTDIALNNAIARVLIENGDIDIDFIHDHTEGFETYRARVFQRTVAEAAAICGVSVEDIRRTARSIAASKGFITMWTMGLNQSVAGVHKNLSLISLNLITGHIGKPGSGPFSLTGQPNAMGGREVGGLATLLAAHRDLKNPAHRLEVQTYWGSGPISATPGLTAPEMFAALESGRLKAVWIIGTNPLVSLPDVRAAERGLSKARFVVVQEVSRKPETLAYADVVLPAAAWAEKEGTMTNSERRISRLHKVTDAPGEALADWEIICRLATAMGFPGFSYKSPSEIYDEHAGLTKGTNIDVSGVNYALLGSGGTVQWPLPAAGASAASPAGPGGPSTAALTPRGAAFGPAGTPRLFTDRHFYTPSGRARFHDLPDDARGETTDGDYPFILTTGRIRDQWHTMSKTGKVRKLNQHIPRSFVEMHPDDARRLGVAEDDLICVSSRRGEVVVRARVTDSIRRGVLFLPMHWGKILQSDLNRANNVTKNVVDPLSGEPDFKYCAVAAEKYVKPFQRIVIVGAGTGAFAFIRAHRERYPHDEITVFSKEINPFYNRILLPGYVSGEHDWESMQNLREGDEQHFTLHRGVAVTAIDRAGKYVVDSRGERTPYDILLLATGSRATWPKQVPSLEGLFTLRTREDGDRFRSMLFPGARAVIAGGGLIGLEMAASLREMGVHVTIVHRSARFMERQLDPLASQLLHGQITDMGCDTFYNDEVQLFYGDKAVTGIRLKSGRYLDCDAVMFGIGTTPNIELARECGLPCQRGVVVNERMQTADPSIFAIGEIAECKGMMFGIAAAAEEQAGILARWLEGDVAAAYNGTLAMNILKIQGFDLCSLGLTTCPDDPAYEEIVFIDKAKRYYKKCIVHQDRLVGAILIGDKQELQEFREMIAGELELSEKRLQLLRSGKKAEPVLGKLVCSCQGVGAGNIRAAAEKGSCTVKDIGIATGAGTGCGSCKPEIQRILESLAVPL